MTLRSSALALISSMLLPFVSVLAQPPIDGIPKPPYKRLVGPETLNPGARPYHFPYPDEYDSVVAAPEVHHLRYADNHIRFIEVAYFPGVRGQMHGHPYASVFAVDSPGPQMVNVTLDPGPGMIEAHSQPPPGAPRFPFCRAASPEAPHAETNQGTYPVHFYRLEFLRVDGADFATHWREWYPHMSDPPRKAPDVKPPANAPKLSASWPYPIAYDSILAASSSHKLLYEDDHVRLIEVTVLPGQTENMHGHPYPSVLAYDAIGSGPIGAVGNARSTIEDHYLDPASTLNGQDRIVAPLPKGMIAPGCATLGPQAPHKVHNTGSIPLHFYRIEFKRIDGDGLKDHWQTWYPWLKQSQEAYERVPYVLNY